MIDDLSLDPDDDGAPKRAPALYVSPPATFAELFAMEQAHREAARDYPGAGEIIFTAMNDETGAEDWDEEKSARHWQRLMKWPRLPTITEALAFQANANARMQAALWYTLNGGKAEAG
jgi:hypothetical protein